MQANKSQDGQVAEYGISNFFSNMDHMVVEWLCLSRPLVTENITSSVNKSIIYIYNLLGPEV